MRKALSLPGLLLVFSILALPALAETATPSGQQTSDEVAIELAFWSTVKDTKDPAILQTYLDRYPNGAFAGLARVMMERLVKDQEAKQEAAAPSPTGVTPQPEIPPATPATAPEPAPSPSPSTATPAQPEPAPAPTAAATGSAPEAKLLTLRATLKAREGASRPYLGVQIGEVTDAWAKAAGMPERKGALVLSSLKNSPAELAGAQPGDVIVKAGEASVSDYNVLPKIVSGKPVGSELVLEVWRTGNGAGDLLRSLMQRAEAGDADAQKAMAHAYARGFAGLDDPNEAVGWYRKAAALGDAGAMLALGAAYADGKSVAKDQGEAVNWYRKAAELGDAAAMATLGQAYAYGLGGIAKDEAEALRWFRKAAATGNPGALNSLGVFYETGRGGVTKDEVEAVKVYRRSADLGNLEGMTSLAVMLVYGKGTAKDEAEAVRLLRVAAEGGHARASYVLGILTLQGQGGLAKDSAEAARLFRTAANLGNTSAMAELASMLQAGDGGPANPDEAAAWMYRALTLGDAFAYQQMRKNAAAWSLPFRKAFQRVMQQNGKYSGPLDGKFGSTTFAAIDALAKPN